MKNCYAAISNRLSDTIYSFITIQSILIVLKPEYTFVFIALIYHHAKIIAQYIFKSISFFKLSMENDSLDKFSISVKFLNHNGLYNKFNYNNYFSSDKNDNKVTLNSSTFSNSFFSSIKVPWGFLRFEN